MIRYADASAGHRRWAGRGIGLGGIALLLVGPFLPWITSGEATHDLYRASGMVQRLVWQQPHPVVLFVIAGLGPALMLVVVLAVCGLGRSAAILALALAGIYLIGGVATLLLGVADTIPLVHVSTIGPSAIVVGSLLLAGGAIASK